MHPEPDRRHYRLWALLGLWGIPLVVDPNVQTGKHPGGEGENLRAVNDDVSQVLTSFEI
jgi:hypothetical protein